MRVLISTYESADVAEERGEALAKLARTGTLLRTTRSVNGYGQADSEIELRHYTAEDGGERWAVVSESPDMREVTDSADRAEADAAYESEVRGLAGCVGEHDAPWWTESDVEGVEHAAFTLTVELLTGEDWSSDETAGHLGRELNLPRGFRADGGNLVGLNGVAAPSPRRSRASRKTSTWRRLWTGRSATVPRPPSGVSV
ncbi:hypothetical protein [Streptomyces sp. NPDC094049]|uniref:hypothetical protein n=1 Tax=Streptomyces sp. NPDC094049 TaxID=3154987 RepID=UPI00332E1B5F